jgi:hypothetical protein
MHDFTGTDGNSPGILVFGADSRLYGCAFSGSASSGVIFRTRRDGTGFQVVYDFAKSKSMSYPSKIFMGADGALYGIARSAVSTYDAIFRITSDGSSVKDLRDFTKTDGDYVGGLLQGKDGALYGYTLFDGPGGVGNIFTMNVDGTGFRDLHDFNLYQSNNTVLLQGSDQRLYGVCEGLGNGAEGTIPFGVGAVAWSMATDGTGFKVLHDFNESYEAPYTLAFGTDGALYGFTYGDDRDVSIPPALPYGDTLFRLTADGAHFDYLHWLPADGPGNMLAVGQDGALYGLTLASNTTPALIYSHTMTPDPAPALALLSAASLPGMTTQVKATLMLEGKAIANMPVDFLIGTFDLGLADTDSNGIAELNFPVPSWFVPAQYGFHLYSAGITTSDDVTLQPARLDSYFTVLAASAVVVTPVTGTIGKQCILTATLTSGGVPLPAESLTFLVGSTVLGSGETNSKGKAVLTCVIPASVGVGSLTLAVQFAGDSVYGASSGTANLTVGKAPVTISTVARTSRQKQNTVLVGTLKRATDNSPLANVNLRFQIDGTAVGTATTDSTGKGSLTYTVPTTLSVGKHTVSIFFDGDSLDSAGSVTTTLTVTS